MQPETIIELYCLGWSNADIAHANEQSTGWLPSRSAMSRKLRDLELPARRASHRKLIPWRINPHHAHNQIYYALMAISRERQGIELNHQDYYRVKWLRDLLTAGGAPKVVAYDYDKGFQIVRARKSDTDIIRRPVPPDNESSVASSSPPTSPST